MEEPETEVDCQAYGVEKRDPGARQSHDGYQLLVGERIYLFYGWNVGSQPPVGDKISRTDMQLEEGFWMRWSDDYGVTFSGGRVLIPVRRTAIDRSNPWQGPTMGAFCCDKPTIIDGMVYFAFQKTVDGNGESYGSEVFFMRSRDLLQLHVDNRPEAATWDTLPLGDDGLQTPRGLLLGEEPHVIQISGSKLLCLWRTELGFFDTRVSDDYGETWSGGRCPVPLGYSGSGGHVSIMGMVNGAASGERRVVQSVAGAVVRNTDLIVDSGQYLQSAEYRDLITTNHDVMRNVRGAFTPAKLRDGSIVMLYYNNGHTDKLGYVGRLVVWLTMGRVDGDTIVWSQPEIALWWDGIQLDSREDWNEDWAIVDGAGYHDIQELPDGCVVFVESNKLTVRYHTIDKDIIHWLRHQLQCPVSTKAVSPSDAVLTWTHGADPSMRAPVLPDLRSGAGFSLAISLNTSHLPDNTIVLVDGMSTVSGSLDEEDAEDITKGFKIVAGEGQLKMLLTDGFGINFEFQIENLNAEHLRRSVSGFVRTKCIPIRIILYCNNFAGIMAWLTV